jgi:hypothetical protein
MMRAILGASVCLLSSVSAGQTSVKELTYYTLGFNLRSQEILGSQDTVSGAGFSLAVGRNDPKLRIGNVKAELIWEGYYLQRTDSGLNGIGATEAEAFGFLASARYRWKFRSNMNLFYDVGFGVQWSNHTSHDLPLAFNTTPTLALGLEIKTRGEGAILLGTRLLHVSNGGRKSPNPGQNLLQTFIGFKYQH